jgi:hypothetical protein
MISTKRIDDFVKNHQIDGKVKSSYARRATGLLPAGPPCGRGEGKLSKIDIFLSGKSRPQGGSFNLEE